jgi:hypothetical protein
VLKSKSLSLGDTVPDTAAPPDTVAPPDTEDVPAKAAPGKCSVDEPLRGWLHKKGERKGAAWKRRWCEFDGSALRYYKNKTDRQPAGLVPREILTMVNMAPEEESTAPTQFVFIAVTSGARADYQFSAETAAERRTWVTALSQDIAPPDREGFLFKRGAHNSSWKRRFFVLRGRELAYFELPSDRVPKGFIDAGGESGMSTNESEPHCFHVRSGDRRFQLRAANELDMDGWLRALSKCRVGAVDESAEFKSLQGDFEKHPQDEDDDDEEEVIFQRRANVTDFARQTELVAQSPTREAGRHSISWSRRPGVNNSTSKVP